VGTPGKAKNPNWKAIMFRVCVLVSGGAILFFWFFPLVKLVFQKETKTIAETPNFGGFGLKVL